MLRFLSLYLLIYVWNSVHYFGKVIMIICCCNLLIKQFLESTVLQWWITSKGFLESILAFLVKIKVQYIIQSLGPKCFNYIFIFSCIAWKLKIFSIILMPWIKGAGYSINYLIYSIKWPLFFNFFVNEMLNISSIAYRKLIHNIHESDFGDWRGCF